jgi:uncharacterized membrane protein
LYFAVFAAGNLWHLVSVPIAFALMSLVTLLAGGIAVRFNSILVAVLGIIGGYGTPIMLSTGVVNFPGLYGYMLVLGIGVLGLCYWKNWPLVNYLSFAATYVLFFASMRDYDVSHLWEVMPFLTAFFVLFSTMTFLYKIVNKSRSNLLDLLALLVNAGVYYAVSYRLVDQLYGSKWVAAVTLSLAAFYTAHMFYFMMRRLVDRDLLVSFIGLAAFFLTPGNGSFFSAFCIKTGTARVSDTFRFGPYTLKSLRVRAFKPYFLTYNCTSVSEKRLPSS